MRSKREEGFRELLPGISAGNADTPEASVQPTVVFAFPLSLGNTVISMLNPVHNWSCCCTASARGKLEKHNHFVSKAAKNQGRLQNLKPNRHIQCEGVAASPPTSVNQWELLGSQSHQSFS